jgi:SAM-dependent methyltransferase
MLDVLRRRLARNFTRPGPCPVFAESQKTDGAAAVVQGGVTPLPITASSTAKLEAGSTDPKPIGLFPADLADLSNENFDLIAKTVSSVVRRAIPRKFDQRMAALAGGDTDANRFFYVGLEWLEFLIRHGRLPPWGKVLDIGCGTGRMAVPLSYYIAHEGEYHGFDVLQESIDYCKREIEHPAFHFDRVDLSHYLYNQHGVIRSDTYDFPYPDEFFDATFAASVFTHLDVPTASNYLRQIRRTLRPGGRAILSFHAIPADAFCGEGELTRLLGVGQGEWAYRFRNRGNGYYTHCDEYGAPKNHYLSDPIGDPVAFEIGTFINMCTEANLKVIEVLPGAWWGESYRFGWQDMVILESCQVTAVN